MLSRPNISLQILSISDCARYANMQQTRRIVAMTSGPVNALDIQILTIDHVPGREIDRALGVVLGQGDYWFGTARERVDAARKTALTALRNNAMSAGADAVIGVTITVTGVKGFWGIPGVGQSAVVQAYGTAVKFKD